MQIAVYASCATYKGRCCNARNDDLTFNITVLAVLKKNIVKQKNFSINTIKAYSSPYGSKRCF